MERSSSERRSRCSNERQRLLRPSIKEQRDRNGSGFQEITNRRGGCRVDRIRNLDREGSQLGDKIVVTDPACVVETTAPWLAAPWVGELSTDVASPLRASGRVRRTPE